MPYAGNAALARIKGTINNTLSTPAYAGSATGWHTWFAAVILFQPPHARGAQLQASAGV